LTCACSHFEISLAVSSSISSIAVSGSQGSPRSGLPRRRARNYYTHSGARLEPQTNSSPFLHI
jgi:hypothetical protein